MRSEQMKIKVAVVLGVVLLSAMSAFAQDYAKVEIPIVYSYMRFNPEDSHIVSGFSLNGGGGAVTYYFNHLIGITAEFNGYTNLRKSFAFPAGTSLCPVGCNVTSDGNTFNYNFWPTFNAYRHQPFQPLLV